MSSNEKPLKPNGSFHSVGGVLFFDTFTELPPPSEKDTRTAEERTEAALIISAALRKVNYNLKQTKEHACNTPRRP